MEACLHQAWDKRKKERNEGNCDSLSHNSDFFSHNFISNTSDFLSQNSLTIAKYKLVIVR